MVDAVLLAVQQAMLSAPPALIQDAGPGEAEGRAAATFAARLDRLAREADRTAADWRARAEAAVAALAVRIRAGDLSPESWAHLRDTARALEERTARDARDFEAMRKGVRRSLATLKAGPRADVRVARRAFDRALASAAEQGLVRYELGLAIRALLAEADPAGRDGPVFDDPAELERHLQAAIG